ncbi:MAG: NADH-quinone oxidoreductase subunit J [Betaproteobacteria bacterium]
MTFQTLLFYFLSLVLIAATVGVITSRNPVNAALLLVLAFFTSSGLWILLEAEFLAIVLVLVYVGAVMVLFLFVVMMLDVDLESLRKGFWRNFHLAASLGAVVALELTAVLMGGFRLSQPAHALGGTAATVPNTQALGIALYTEFLYPLELAAVILLVAIIAAIALTLRKRKDSKFQDPSEQIRVQPQDRVRLVKMKSVVPEIVDPVKAPLAEEKK